MFESVGKKIIYQCFSVVFAILIFGGTLIATAATMIVGSTFILVDEIYLFVRDGRRFRLLPHSKRR